MVFIVGGADPNRSFSDVHTIDLGKTSSGGDFPGCSMTKTSPSYAGGAGSILARGAEIPHA